MSGFEHETTRAAQNTHLETLNGFQTGLVDVNTAHATLCAGIIVIKPEGGVWVGNGDRKLRDRREVACLPETRVEAVHRRVDLMSRNTRRPKQCLDSCMVSLRDYGARLSSSVDLRGWGTYS